MIFAAIFGFVGGATLSFLICRAISRINKRLDIFSDMYSVHCKEISELRVEIMILRKIQENK